jgi:hypothetical protein
MNKCRGVRSRLVNSDERDRSEALLLECTMELNMDV